MKNLHFFLLGVVSGVLLAACGGGVQGTTEQPSTGGGSVPQREVTRAGGPVRNADRARRIATF